MKWFEFTRMCCGEPQSVGRCSPAPALTAAAAAAAARPCCCCCCCCVSLLRSSSISAISCCLRGVGWRSRSSATAGVSQLSCRVRGGAAGGGTLGLCRGCCYSSWGERRPRRPQWRQHWRSLQICAWAAAPSHDSHATPAAAHPQRFPSAPASRVSPVAAQPIVGQYCSVQDAKPADKRRSAQPQGGVPAAGPPVGRLCRRRLRVRLPRCVGAGGAGARGRCRVVLQNRQGEAAGAAQLASFRPRCGRCGPPTGRREPCRRQPAQQRFTTLSHTRKAPSPPAHPLKNRVCGPLDCCEPCRRLGAAVDIRVAALQAGRVGAGRGI